MTSRSVDFEGLYQRLAAAERALHEPDDEAREALLQRRVQALARAREAAPEVALTVLAFRLAGERWGVRLTELEQVVECAGLCPLPGAPPAVLGALSVRAGIVPVLDLRALLGLAGGPLSNLAFVVVLVAGAERFGLAVEDTEGAVGLQADQLVAAPAGPFAAATREGLKVLDPGRLVSH